MPTYVPSTVPGAAVEDVEAPLSVGEVPVAVGFVLELVAVAVGLEEDVAALDGDSTEECVGREVAETGGSEAEAVVEDCFEFRAWSPNAPTPTPIANSRTGTPTRASGRFFGGCGWAGMTLKGTTMVDGGPAGVSAWFDPAGF